ncbi:MAG: translation initiation factor IF-2 [Candidatus Aenigmarchaeota archaeon]|nr:translation initiation factor IF-2 [Candidatus Aenigmarchaeota archaeon]MDW8159838.1 translation initiation factor IF-2 [Candidatus Aenigmarchaeota archaeon]
MTEAIRSPIVITVGHVDHGKTTLLDSIRGTCVTKLEPGELTQHVGASFIPTRVIQNLCRDFLEKMKIKIEIPGLLFIDTPGHAAFISMREKGSSIADLAVLVVDVNEGFQEQTHESLKILREYKVPFVVAATKIDKVAGWRAQKTTSFLESIKHQDEKMVRELDLKIYKIVSTLSEYGFDSDRFDRIEDFTKKIAIVPVSSITKEGLAELISILSGLAQKFLRKRLKLTESAKGIILEVKEVEGLGTTLDVILYDGKISKNDIIVIGGKEPIVGRIRALLVPRPLQEMRVEKKFESINEVYAACGVKIVVPNVENVIAGMPIRVVKNEKELEKVIMDVKMEKYVEFDKDPNGVIVKADTIGSLEAMIKLLKDEGIGVRKADIGKITREDLIEGELIQDKYRKVILAFNVKVSEEDIKEAKNFGLRLIHSNVIYRIIEEYKKWVEEEKKKDVEEKLKTLPRPVVLKVIPNAIFRQSKPAIFGVDVIAGVLKPNILLKKKDGKIVGRVKEIQSEGRRIDQARKGERVAISIEEAVIGKNVFENDILESHLSDQEIEELWKIIDYLSDDEKELMKKSNNLKNL